MSGEGIFHIGPSGELLSLEPKPYEAEDVLQALLETHPDLLAGAQMTPEAPRRWALVKREQGVPDRDNAGTRWSIDHLFVDQDAVPTLVEVKRSTDTRIRREVVGQMLDYAANGVRYWPVESLRLAFETTQGALGADPLEALTHLTGDPKTTVEEFFGRVGDNLRAGRIRMVFVADVVPDELMRIVEFLNEQMDPAEVFAVQVRQFRADRHDGTVIVPAVFGRTAAASTKGQARRPGDRAAALAASSPETLQAVRLLEDLAQQRGLLVQATPSASMLKSADGSTIAGVYLAPWNSLEIGLEQLRSRGWVDEADDAFDALRGATTKVLTRKSPLVPAEDVVANWDRISRVLVSIADLYRAP